MYVAGSETMDLRDFYLENIKEDEYHYRFKEVIEGINKDYDIFTQSYEIIDVDFEIYDVEEAILKFKELCQPEKTYNNTKEKCWFYLVTYYLHKVGYEIKEFPRILARPPIEPGEFTCRDIRNRIIAQGGDDYGTVRYATRRTFVASLTFELKTHHIAITDSINQKFIEISNRQSSFNNMSTDEKLAEIANLIENMLKKDGRFVTVDYSSICLDYINEETVREYRHRLQCFRHSSNEAIQERISFTNEQKLFLIDYGLVIIKAIHELI